MFLAAATISIGWCTATMLLIALNTVTSAARRMSRPVIRVLAAGWWPAYLVFGARMCWLVIDVMRDEARSTRALTAALLFLGFWVVLGLFWLQLLRSKAQEITTTEDPGPPMP